MKYIEAEVEITFRKKIVINRANWDKKAEQEVMEKASRIVNDNFDNIRIMDYKRNDTIIENGLTPLH